MKWLAFQSNKVKKKPEYPKRTKAWEQNTALDAFITSSSYDFGKWLYKIRVALRNISNFFRMNRISKFFFWFFSFGLSCFTVGLVFLTWLSMPALDAANRNLQNAPQVSAVFYDRQGKEIGRRGAWRSDPVPLNEMPEYFVQAVLATEDRRFFNHFGLDFQGLLRAFITNAQAQRVVQGGSTITQQLAKNMFLTPEQSLERKINEAFISLWLEARFSKPEILRMYFDRTYMGAGVVGVDAAAEYYFDKTLRDINLSEAAILAGMFKAPTRYAPHKNLPRARGRANEVLSNLVEAGYMTEGQVYTARINPAKAVKRVKVPKSDVDYFLDYAFQELQTLLPEGQHIVKAKTSIDLEIQRVASETMQTSFRNFSDEFRFDQGALLSADSSGAIRAMIGGKDYGESQFNRATQALRQPGSAFKPIVYATALSNGYKRTSRELDEARTIRGYTPRNYYKGSKGRVTLQAALAISINTIPVNLTHNMGRMKVVEMAQQLGVKSPVRYQSNPSLPLGSSETTVMDMANVYNVFLNEGLRTPLYAIEDIQTMRGDVLFDRKKDAQERVRILDEQVAHDMNIMMQNVIYGGTARRAQIEGLPTVGKTGTTSGNKDGWFVGFSGNMVTSVWFGNDSTQPTNKISGGNVPAITWQAFMARAHDRLPAWKPIPGVKFKISRPELVVAEIDIEDNQLSEDIEEPQTAKPVQRYIETIPAAMSKTLDTLSESLKITRNKANALLKQNIKLSDLSLHSQTQ